MALWTDFLNHVYIVVVLIVFFILSVFQFSIIFAMVLRLLNSFTIDCLYSIDSGIKEFLLPFQNCVFAPYKPYLFQLLFLAQVFIIYECLCLQFDNSCISSVFIVRVHVTSINSYWQILGSQLFIFSHRSRHFIFALRNSYRRDSLYACFTDLFYLYFQAIGAIHYYIIIAQLKVQDSDEVRLSIKSSKKQLDVRVYNYKIQIQKEMSIQLKHGDSGHSQLILMRRGLKGEDIINHIGNMYKISPKDQLIITKQGHIVEPHEPMDSGHSQQSCNKTLSTGFKNESKLDANENGRSFCLFLFNLKQLSKPDENCQGKSKSYWVDELKQKLINLNNENSTVFPYDSLDESYQEDELQRYQKFVSKINSLRESYKRLANEYSDMKQYSYKIEQTTERCANQKKASSILTRSLKSQFDLLSVKLKDITILKQSFRSKITIEDKSLRENSGFFQNRKKNQNSVQLYENQIKNLKESYEKFAPSLKEEMKKVKLLFRKVEQKILEFTNKKHILKLQECHRLNKKDYDQIVTLFGQLVQSGASCESKYGLALEAKIQRSSQNVSNVLLNEFSEICQELTNYYCEFNQLNEENKSIIKNTLLWYNRARNQIRNFFKSALSIEKTIGIEIQQQNKRKISIITKKMQSSISQMSESRLIHENSTLQTSQIERRIKFRKILNSLQSLASKICLEEETSRKKFVTQMKFTQKIQYQCLRNPKVPEIDLEDNGSSDVQLMKIFKSSSIDLKSSEASSQEFMVYSFNLVMEKLKTINNLNESNSKIKNLQQILKRASEIFAKVYNKKINDLIGQKQAISLRIPELQHKILSLQFEIETQKCYIKDLTNKLSEKQDKLIIRQKERSEQINKQRSRYEKLLNEFKSLEKSLSKQTKVNQQLYSEFMKNEDELKDSMQLNEYLKQLLAQKEIQIIEIEKRMSEREKTQKQVSKGIQSDLKSAVMQNFSKDINSTSEKDGQIQRLKEQVAILEKENQELLEEIQELSAQMRKIITKQTLDIQIQVNTDQPASKLLPSDCITINQQISVGQNALFMPFSNAIYVGVNYKDDDKTICNINNVQYNNYFLDFSCFNSKTRQLLTQCSFLVVIHVSNVEKEGGKMMVKGEVRYLFGFQDDNMGIKNYKPLLPHE